MAGHLIDVPAQDRGKVGVDDGGIAARDQLHQRAHLAGQGDLREADLLRHAADHPLMLWIQVAVQAHDRDRPNALVVRRLQAGTQRGQIRGPDDGSFGRDSFVHLDYQLVEQFGQHDVPVEDARPVLVADPQRVTETSRDHEYRALSRTFEQRIGRNRRAHPDCFHAFYRDPTGCADVQQFADGSQGSVPVTSRVLREQLVGDQGPVRAARDDVGEGASTVDPELPTSGHRLIRSRRTKWSGSELDRTTTPAKAGQALEPDGDERVHRLTRSPRSPMMCR